MRLSHRLDHWHIDSGTCTPSQRGGGRCRARGFFRVMDSLERRELFSLTMQTFKAPTTFATPTGIVVDGSVAYVTEFGGNEILRIEQNRDRGTDEIVLCV